MGSEYKIFKEGAALVALMCFSIRDALEQEQSEIALVSKEHKFISNQLWGFDHFTSLPTQKIATWLPRYSYLESKLALL